MSSCQASTAETSDMRLVPRTFWILSRLHPRTTFLPPWGCRYHLAETGSPVQTLSEGQSRPESVYIIRDYVHCFPCSVTKDIKAQ